MVTGRYTSKENREIMETVFKENEDALTNPGIKDDDITSEVLREYLDNRSRNPNKVKIHSRLIQDYVAIKNSL